MRSAARLKMGYYPLPESEGKKLRALLSCANQASVIDPCVGQPLHRRHRQRKAFSRDYHFQSTTQLEAAHLLGIGKTTLYRKLREIDKGRHSGKDEWIDFTALRSALAFCDQLRRKFVIPRDREAGATRAFQVRHNLISAP